MLIEVKSNYFKDKHLPTKISYDGYWNVPFYKPEKIKFILNFFDYDIQVKVLLVSRKKC